MCWKDAGNVYPTTVIQPDTHFEDNLRKDDQRRKALPTSAFIKTYHWGKPVHRSFVATKQIQKKTTNKQM